MKMGCPWTRLTQSFGGQSWSPILTLIHILYRQSPSLGSQVIIIFVLSDLSACRYHSGDSGIFPNTTKLIVGSGFKDAYLPGYPVDEDGEIVPNQYE